MRAATMSACDEKYFFVPWIAFLLLGGIFILDLFTPIGLVIPVLYIVPLLLAMAWGSRSFFMAVTALAGVFSVLGYFYGPLGGIPWIALTNRVLTGMTLAATAGVYLFYRRLETQYTAALRNFLPLCTGCRKVRDDHGYWKRLESYLEEHGPDRFLDSFCPQCTAAYSADLLEEKAAREAAAEPIPIPTTVR